MLLVHTKALKAALNVVKRAKTKSTLEVLKNFAIVAGDNSMMVQACDLEKFYQATIPCINPDPFVTTVGVKDLMDIVTKEKGQYVEMDPVYNSDHTFIMGLRVGWSTLSVIDYAEFPPHPKFEEDTLWRSRSSFWIPELRDTLEGVVISASDDDGRPILNSVNLDDRPFMAAADGFRFHRFTFGEDIRHQSEEYNVPAAFIRDLVEVWKKCSTNVTWSLHSAGALNPQWIHTGWEKDGIVYDAFCSLVTEGTFPDLRTLLPEPQETDRNVKIDIGVFIDRLEKMKTITRINPVSMYFNGEVLTLFSREDERKGHLTFAVDQCDFKGTFIIAFNVQFLLDAAKLFQPWGRTMNIRFTHFTSPALFTSDNSHFSAFVMPMHTEFNVLEAEGLLTKEELDAFQEAMSEEQKARNDWYVNRQAHDVFKSLNDGEITATGYIGEEVFKRLCEIMYGNPLVCNRFNIDLENHKIWAKEVDDGSDYKVYNV